MGEVVTIEARPRRPAECRRRSGPGIVRAFPGARMLRMVDNIAAHMATLDDVKAEEFLVSHLEIEEARLIRQGISDPEIDRHIFEAARAVWAHTRSLKAGVA